MNAERDEAVRVLTNLRDGRLRTLNWAERGDIIRAIDTITSPPAVPDGFVVVPREPTEAMVRAANRAPDERTLYQRMLAAYGEIFAPPPSEPKCVHDWGGADERQSCAKCGEHIGMDPSGGKQAAPHWANVSDEEWKDPSPAEQGARESGERLNVALDVAAGLLAFVQSIAKGENDTFIRLRSTFDLDERHAMAEALRHEAIDAIASLDPDGEGCESLAAECLWSQQDSGGDWVSTACGNEFVLNDAGQYPGGGQVFPHCPYCAKPTTFRRWEKTA